ncbi:unnamed protein product, partial [Prorocentrum cordatum]
APCGHRAEQRGRGDFRGPGAGVLARTRAAQAAAFHPRQVVHAPRRRGRSE